MYSEYERSANKINGAIALSGRGATATRTRIRAACARTLTQMALMPSSANGTYMRKLSAGYDCAKIASPVTVGVTRFFGTLKMLNAGCMVCAYGLVPCRTSSAEYALKSIASVPYEVMRNSVKFTA